MRRRAFLAAWAAAAVAAPAVADVGGDQFSRAVAARREGLPSEATVANAAADLTQRGQAALAAELRALSRLAELQTVAGLRTGLTQAEAAELARLAPALGNPTRAAAVARIAAILDRRRALTAAP